MIRMFAVAMRPKSLPTLAFAEAGHRWSPNDAQNVAFLHDQQLFAVDLDLGARPLAEQDLVAGLDIARGDLAVVGPGAGADRDDFALARLFLGAVGNDDPAGGLFIGFDTAHEHAVVQRTEVHGFLP